MPILKLWTNNVVKIGLIRLIPAQERKNANKGADNMCGIVGYTGNLQAASIILDGLSKLEYRGYDSAGIAVLNEKGHTEVVKAKGRLQNLIDKTDSGKCKKTAP